jgi:ribosomal protein S3AE
MAEKVKKKKFVKIIAPRQFNERVIGESVIGDARSLIGRKLKINMMSLTDNPKNQNVQIKFKITDLKGESVKTEIVGYTLLPAFVKRLVRKEKKRVDDCFYAKTNDGKDLKVKTFLLTLNKTTKSVLTALRKATQESIKTSISKMSYDALMNELIMHKLQNTLRRELAKVYPLKQCEVRDIQLIESKKKEEEAPKKKVKIEAPKVEEKKSEVKKEVVEEKKEEPKKEEVKVPKKEE